MGGRGNIYVKEGKEPGVYLYAHWGGHDLPGDLQTALARKWRWNDVAYLTRIIFCEMVKGHEAEETSFGISTHVPDNEHKLLVVDCESERVFVTECPYGSAPDGDGLSFAEYVALSPKKLAEFSGRGEE